VDTATRTLEVRPWGGVSELVDGLRLLAEADRRAAHTVLSRLGRRQDIAGQIALLLPGMAPMQAARTLTALRAMNARTARDVLVDGSGGPPPWCPPPASKR
jgi:hypothetical protein